MTKKTLAGIAMASILTVAACLPAAGARAAALDIDVILPLTGPGAFLGKAQQVALQHMEAAIASGAIKTLQPHFVFHDDQSSPQNAVQLATAVMAKKPKLIIGSSLVAMCNAMAPLMKNGPVMYCLSPGIHPPAGSFVFTAGVDTRDMASVLIRYWRLSGIRRLGIITSTDASGQDAERNFRTVLALPENKEMQIVGEARFAPNDVSVTAQIERIKETNPQALIAWATGGPVATVFKAVVASGLDIPVGTTNGNMNYAQMGQYKDFLPKELVIPTSSWMEVVPGRNNPALEAAHAPFFKAFKDAGERPDSSNTLAWDPTLMMLGALQELGPDATAEQLRAKLASTVYTGLNGFFDFNGTPQRGLNEDSVIVSRWDPAADTWVAIGGPHGIPLK